jgi:FkbH-like protein
VREQLIGETQLTEFVAENEWLQRLSDFRAVIEMKSLLVWGEHCSECAAPECFKTCSLYDRRPDLKCRRFVNGIESLDIRGLDRGQSYGMRVAFKQWGKLEAAGRLTLHRLDRTAFAENISHIAGGILGVMPGWRFPFADAGRSFDRMAEFAASRGESLASKDQFVIEAVNLGHATGAFTFSAISADPVERASIFQRRFDLASGYNRIQFRIADIDAMAPLIKRTRFLIEPVGDPLPNAYIFTFIDAMRLRSKAPDRPAKLAAHIDPPPKVKCVVWDLDNTLWRGTLVEDSPENLTLTAGVRDVIEELDRRGILQSIASKNDKDAVFAVLDRFGIRDYFLYPQIGWNPKSESIAAIKDALDIGLDTFVFIDDQPFERAEVAQVHPDVRVVDASELPSLLSRPDFAVPATEESASRRHMYMQEQKRAGERDRSSSGYIGFLRSCAIKLTLLPVNLANFERIYELTQRTNQLNYSGGRFERDDVMRLMDQVSPHHGIVMACNDRFGEYGIIGLVVIDREQWLIRHFFMSCRVQRKMVESALISFLAGRAANAGFPLRILYRKTARNSPARIMLDELGFTPIGELDGTQVFSIEQGADVANSDIVEMSVDPALSSALRQLQSLEATS